MNPLWSYLLAAVGILGLLLAGRRRAIGWAIGFGAQALWVIYAIVTDQPGFIVSALAYAAVYARNWWVWRTPQMVVVADATGFASGDVVLVDGERRTLR